MNNYKDCPQYTLSCSQLISSSDNKKILLTTRNVSLDSGNYATKYYCYFIGIYDNFNLWNTFCYIFDQKSTPSSLFLSKLLHWGHASIHNCGSWHYVAVADDSQWVVIGANKPLWLKSLTFRLLCISWCMYVVWQLCYVLFVCFTRFIFGSLNWTTEILLCIVYVYHGLLHFVCVNLFFRLQQSCLSF